MGSSKVGESTPTKKGSVDMGEIVTDVVPTLWFALVLYLMLLITVPFAKFFMNKYFPNSPLTVLTNAI